MEIVVKLVAAETGVARLHSRKLRGKKHMDDDITLRVANIIMALLLLGYWREILKKKKKSLSTLLRSFFLSRRL